MRLTITTDCSYTHLGYERREYAAGQQVETDDAEFAAVALSEGWATEAGPTSDEVGEQVAAPASRAKKAHHAAPENKSAE
jgi:hypothetical protein